MNLVKLVHLTLRERNLAGCLKKNDLKARIRTPRKRVNPFHIFVTIFVIVFQNKMWGPGEMAQWLRVLVAPTKDMSSIPTTT